MTTVKLNAEIASDGSLRLDVPVGLPPGKAEVVLVVQSHAASDGTTPPGAGRRARSGLFVGRAGDAIDVDAALKEINEAWRSKLSDLP